MYGDMRPLSFLESSLSLLRCYSCLIHNSIHSRCFSFHIERPGDERTNWLTDMYEQTAQKHDIRPLIYGPWKMSIADTFTPTISSPLAPAPPPQSCLADPCANTRHATVNVASSSFLIKHRRWRGKWGVCDWESPTFIPIDGRVDTNSNNSSPEPRGVVTQEHSGNKPARHSTRSVTVSISIFDKPPTQVTLQIKSTSLPPSVNSTTTLLPNRELSWHRKILFLIPAEWPFINGSDFVGGVGTHA